MIRYYDKILYVIHRTVLHSNHKLSETRFRLRLRLLPEKGTSSVCLAQYGKLQFIESKSLTTFSEEYVAQHYTVKVMFKNNIKLEIRYAIINDRLCGLVVRVPGYRSRGPGSILSTSSFSVK
jgi:hypothetical protein